MSQGPPWAVKWVVVSMVAALKPNLGSIICIILKIFIIVIVSNHHTDNSNPFGTIIISIAYILPFAGHRHHHHHRHHHFYITISTIVGATRF